MTQAIGPRSTQAIYDGLMKQRSNEEEFKKTQQDSLEFHSNIHAAANDVKATPIDAARKDALEAQGKTYGEQVTAFEVVLDKLGNIGNLFTVAKDYLKPSTNAIKGFETFKTTNPELYAVMQADADTATKQFGELDKLHQQFDTFKKQIGDESSKAHSNLTAYNTLVAQAVTPPSSWNFLARTPSISVPAAKADAVKVEEKAAEQPVVINARNPQAVFDALMKEQSTIEAFVKTNKEIGAFRTGVEGSNAELPLKQLASEKLIAQRDDYQKQLKQFEETLGKIVALDKVLTIAEEYLRPSSKIIADLPTIEKTHPELHAAIKADAEVAMKQFAEIQKLHQKSTVYKTYVEGTSLPKAKASFTVYDTAVKKETIPATGWFGGSSAPAPVVAPVAPATAETAAPVVPAATTTTAAPVAPVATQTAASAPAKAAVPAATVTVAAASAPATKPVVASTPATTTPAKPATPPPAGKPGVGAAAAAILAATTNVANALSKVTAGTGTPAKKTA